MSTSSFIHDIVILIKDRRLLFSAIAYSTFLFSAISPTHLVVTKNKTGTTHDFISVIVAIYRSKVENQTICYYGTVRSVVSLQWGLFCLNQSQRNKFKWQWVKTDKGEWGEPARQRGGEGEAVLLIHSSLPRSSTAALNTRSSLREVRKCRSDISSPVPIRFSRGFFISC